MRHGGIFSALFGTPLTATLFAMMVVDVGLMLTVAFVPGFLAALIAYSISLKAGIAPTRFVMEAPPLDARTVVRTAVLAMCCAVVAVIFCQMLHFLSMRFPNCCRIRGCGLLQAVRLWWRCPT